MESVTEARRAKFEAWMRKNGMTQHHPAKHDMWLGFNAALDSLVIELPFEACNGMMNGERVRQAIEKAGVKVNG
jgi:hypothetical protein